MTDGIIEGKEQIAAEWQGMVEVAGHKSGTFSLDSSV